MRLSEQWLREWVSPKLSSEAIAARFTMAGIEVGAIEPVAPGFEGVIVGEILSVASHPSADKLKVCRVDIGKGRELSIVCGADNAAVGLKVPVAMIGAALPGGVRVERADIRGVASEGMLCSEAELGLEQTASGLLVLGGEAPVGEPLRDFLKLDDVTFELELTPNRGDCLSVAGAARELAALTGAPQRKRTVRGVRARGKRRLPVAIRANKECGRYVGRVIEGIDANVLTPIWMRERLRRAGVRSIHPVVDVTNYVMLELGQPMHAFDLTCLTGGIEVRRARPRERLRLLDGKEIDVTTDTLVIADQSGPLALAGIMGGAASAVGAGTRNLFLESAWFSPGTIAGRARAFGLQTESAQRFERGVDPELAPIAMERATELLVAIVGGRAGPVIERRAAAQLPKRRPILLRRERIGRMLGKAMADVVVTTILKRLGMRVTSAAAGWRVTAPSHRFDVEREIDLIEELARVHGYDKIPAQRPLLRMHAPQLPEGRGTTAKLRSVLAARDYQEVITYSFVDPELQGLVGSTEEGPRLANPISADMAVMRTSLWPGLLKTIIHNRNRQLSRVRVFEIGRCFAGGSAEVIQDSRIGGAIIGAALPEQWGSASRPADFFDAKGDVEALFALSGEPSEFSFERGDHPALHPGQSARLLRRGQAVGWIGRLHPALQSRLDLDEPPVLFEVDLEAVLRAKIPAFREISRYPSIRRDLAIVLPDDVSAKTLLEVAQRVAGNLLVDLQLFDEYRGKGIDSGRKSLALALTLQDSSRTLKEEEVEALMGRLVTAVESELGGTLRG